MPGPLLLADAPALLYRAFYALPDSITGVDGRPVNALLGSLNALLQCVEAFDPRAVAICFGQESATYRTDAYPAYHAARPPVPEGLALQWPQAAPLYEAFGWSIVDAEDMEADDLLGSLAAVEAEAGGEALILTGDRDMFQCAGPRVRILMQGRGKGRPSVIGPDEVRAEYGIDPELVPDFIALRGDPSDGIPGAKGIGAKTAADLLRRHGSLDGVLAAAIRERPAVRAALLEQGEELRMFKDLATLRRLPVDRAPDAVTDCDAGAAAVEALGMRRLATRLRNAD